MNFRIITLALTFSVAITIFYSLSEQQKQQNVLGQLQQQQQGKEKDSSSSINHTNKSIVVAFTQAFNNRNITALDKLVSVNEIEHNSLAHQGLDGVQRYFHDLTNTTGTRAQQLMFAAGIPMPGNDISFKTATLSNSR